jgi:NADH-quinone oxidoreductase subunit J
MNASVLIFYILSAFILGAGILSVTSRKIFRSAIWLLFSLMGIAGLYFWMEVDFLAAVQIAVYVGGIVVLIIFSIFLTQQTGREMPKPTAIRNLFSVLAVGFGFGLTYTLIHQYRFPTVARKFDTDVNRIGSQMLAADGSGYALPFELASILLLAAMIGCIVIAMKSNKNTEA